MRTILAAALLVLAGCGGVPSAPPVAPASFEITDAMDGWWVKPNLLRDGERTYVTFTQTDGADGLAIYDHRTGALTRYVIGTAPLAPDDHGAGSVVVGNGRVAVFIQGRDQLAPNSIYSMYYVEFGENENPTGLPLRSFPFSVLGVVNEGSNYPNTYNADGQFFLMARMSNLIGYQWGYVLNTWPLGEFPARRVFYASEKYTWPYFATHRSAADKNVFPIALGFHPFSSTLHSIYYGEIHRYGATQPWDVLSGGRVIGNLTTGAGLPFDETSFELVYAPPAGESTRLFAVSDDVVLFATFGADNVAHYQYATKRFGKWTVHAVISGGLPFQGAGIRNYYGGMSFSNAGVLTLSREDNGTWYVERYITPDNGATWTRVLSVPYSNNVVAARPMDEQLSDKSAPVGDLETTYWFGYYDYSDYTKFSTTLTTVRPL
jgi:hypothetical protein